MGLKLLCIAYLLYRWLKRFQGTLTISRSCLIGQIPAKRFLPQVSSRDIVAGLFSNRHQTNGSQQSTVTKTRQSFEHQSLKIGLSPNQIKSRPPREAPTLHQTYDQTKHTSPTDKRTDQSNQKFRTSK